MTLFFYAFIFLGYFNKMTTNNNVIFNDNVIANIIDNQNLSNCDNNIINANINENANTNNLLDINQNFNKIEKKRGRKKKIIINNDVDDNLLNIQTVDFLKDNQVVDNLNINQVVDNLNINQVVDNLNINQDINDNQKIFKKSNDFLKELLIKQLPNVNITKKLTYNDIKRISKFLTSSIFNEVQCSIWNGYITNEKNQIKGTYINFYFNQKKIALHRLLYLNFIGDILNTEYIKFSCLNKGKCCNIHHMKKYSYNSNLNSTNLEDLPSDNSVHIVQNKKDLIIEL